MKLNELQEIILKSASDSMKREGENAFNNGLVTYCKGKKINNIYHIYGRTQDNSKLKELNSHIKINIKRKKLEGAECSCDEFKEFASSGYTLMCSHITATAYKFFSLLSKEKNETSQKLEKKAIEEERQKKTVFTRLVRKTEKDFIYYEVQTALRSEWLTLKPYELRPFLESLENRKIKFKYDNMEFMVPIMNQDLPVTFNLKEENNHIILTTHNLLPIPLNSNNDVYFFKNEIYMPSKNQVKNFVMLYEKLNAYGKIVYRKNINNYNKLVSILSTITKNINISESLRDFASDLLKPEFYIFEENNKIYCDVILSYGKRKANILNKNKSVNTLISDQKKEEKLLMQIEKKSFIKMKSRFMFIGGDEELFNILSKNADSLHSLGTVILGNGLNDREIYKADSIKADLYDMDGCFNFAYSIEDVHRDELNNVFEAYRGKNKFYKTRSNKFIDFEDDGVRSFFNILEVLNINENIQYENVRVEKSKALYLYENIKSRGLSFIKGTEKLEEIESKLMNINNSNIVLPDNFNGTLRDYQIKGFKWLKTLSEVGFGGILADEMGLGKTIQVIAFLLSEKNKTTFIVCPTSLIYNWKQEFQKFAPSLKVLIVHGTKRIEILNSKKNYDIILTTYGTLRMDIDNYSNTIFDYCIIDEGQNIKNASAQNTKVIKEIKADVKFALTGTPIENNLIELWSIFDFVMPGYLFSKEKFEEKFILREVDNLESLKLLIKPFILRRTKKEVICELPDKVEKKFLVEMTVTQKSIYSNYIKTVRETIKNNKDVKFEIFSFLTKLRQICLDPSLIIKNYNGGSGKLEVAIELIKEHIDSGGKVLLFSQFTSVLDKIEERLNSIKIDSFHLDGKTKPKDRFKMVQDFNSSTSTRVFLISLKAGGTGLNLTAANLVIHFDPWWNPAVEDQATDRAHRIGQSNVVEVIKLVAKGTIEEKIILLQEDKKELIDNMLSGNLQNSSLLSTLSKEDLLQLFAR